MTQRSRFAYVQARLQARYGQQPDRGAWRRLQGIASLSHFLQVARTTPLRPWLLNIPAHGDSHALEKSLRRQLFDQLDEVTRWLPPPWQPALRWCGVLPDLPALQHLLGGRPAPAWVLDDHRLKPYSHELPALRLQALRDSPYAPLLGQNGGRDLAAAWRRHWRTLWPGDIAAADAAALNRLADTVTTYYAALAGAGHNSETAHDWLEQRLRHGFRRHPQQAAAAFYYLALTALTVEQLRGLLLRLSLFPAHSEVA